MSKKNQAKNLRTWIQIDARAAKKNYDTFRKLVGKKVELWSVVKSNAYGHGLYAFSALMDEFGIDGFCVDSVVEGLSLRRAGIKKPILVLGQTLPSRYAEAAAKKIAISISNFDALKALSRAKKIPDFHLKIDTGMHRQGFYLDDVPKVIKAFTIYHLPFTRCKGIFTHFASAKDLKHPAYTNEQLKKYEKAVDLFENAGFKNLMKHASATGGTLSGAKYRFDMVRVGIGLYGLWPSDELERQLRRPAQSRGRSLDPKASGLGTINLHPVLSWRATISEVKKIKKGDYIGYDTTERITEDMTMAVVPIGYWHGFPRALSSTGEVLVRGKRSRVLGRVSMDMIAIAVLPGTKAGAVVTLIGRDAKAAIHASEPARKSGTSHYEFVTRLNPLIERVIIR